MSHGGATLDRDLAANYVVTSAIAFPSLGRNLSSGNVTVNLVEPGTLYGARQNNLDMRIAKILRFRGTRAQFGVDVYNLLNTDVVTTYNQGYTAPTATSGSIWLTPNGDSARALRAAQHAARFLRTTSRAGLQDPPRPDSALIHTPWRRVPRDLPPPSPECVYFPPKVIRDAFSSAPLSEKFRSPSYRRRLRSPSWVSALMRASTFPVFPGNSPNGG